MADLPVRFEERMKALLGEEYPAFSASPSTVSLLGAAPLKEDQFLFPNDLQVLNQGGLPFLYIFRDHHQKKPISIGVFLHGGKLKEDFPPTAFRLQSLS